MSPRKCPRWEKFLPKEDGLYLLRSKFKNSNNWSDPEFVHILLDEEYEFEDFEDPDVGSHYCVDLYKRTSSSSGLDLKNFDYEFIGPIPMH